MNNQEFLLDGGFWGWLYKLLTPIEWLMTWIMNLFHEFLTFIGMPQVGASWVLSIIFLVLVVQACIFPLFYKQMKSMRHMQAIQPKMMKIQNKYKGKTDQASKDAMQREMMKLYQDNHVNPAGSCLPMLIQGPVFMCMFYVLSAIPYIAIGKRDTLGAFDQATAKQFADTHFFGISLQTRFTDPSTMVGGKVVIGLFVAAMCFCLWFMQRYTMKHNTAAASMNKQTETMQKVMLWGFPIMYIFSGIAMPFAVLVYWLTNNICNLLRSVWQVHEFPTPGSPAAEAKKQRDHDRENRVRAKEGRLSLEEEELERAKQAEAERLEKGFQREQPKRKNRKKK
ncbi:membrane protein insertase YidC [Bifidobacterium gallicum]|uniref:Membrane protein insertase YidC n=1 Tax=Bifidobacterium gallicum DSM 20093 = LMG 11596 TaxID=561180 RepID=D1NWE0_9BIFI|nr:membrane protein insertase YidC [Bifidobacterium gallicum]EFA22426.1 membrane protein insertase, YidC/Oxa1 family [Bifidobacterium gallicum DSM 20093 = LMG 11596]KFI60115.1 membrane protein [Bifidobacterium gallicum DSM 20093 = LMG 11596]